MLCYLKPRTSIDDAVGDTLECHCFNYKTRYYGYRDVHVVSFPNWRANEWNRECEIGSAVRGIRGAGRSAVRCGDGRHDRQSEACAGTSIAELAAGRGETLEDQLLLALRYSVAVIADPEVDLRSVVRGGESER